MKTHGLRAFRRAYPSLEGQDRQMPVGSSTQKYCVNQRLKVRTKNECLCMNKEIVVGWTRKFSAERKVMDGGRTNAVGAQ